jgi:hypothetical protein
MPETANAVRELSFGEAVREAIAEEMRRDPSIVLMGEDVAEAGTTFKVLKGLARSSGSTGSSTRRSRKQVSPASASAPPWPGCGRSSTSCSATS